MPFKIPRSEISRRNSEDKINSESLFFLGKTGSQEKCSSSQQTNSSLFSREEFEDSYSQSQSDDSQCFWTSLRKIWSHEDTFEENQELKLPFENAEEFQRPFSSLVLELQQSSRDVEDTIKNLELSTYFKGEKEDSGKSMSEYGQLLLAVCILTQEILQYARSIQAFNERFNRKIQNCQNVIIIRSRNFRIKYLEDITNAHLRLRTAVKEISENCTE
ncbi:hypothetical protein P879_07493 [Paragonimus westermani]|uniref:Uncharacterized protein n=1 Tax=Paragonimus westermani TaxID=34504 RepID=A0A8T0DM84_9TREM|nr:hypothetical protein P879_07493 [Paragonimus westermani]